MDLFGHFLPTLQSRSYGYAPSSLSKLSRKSLMEKFGNHFKTASKPPKKEEDPKISEMNALKFKYMVLGFLCSLLCLGASGQDRGDTRLLEAVQAYSSGDLTGASGRFESLVKSRPDNDAAWYYLGLCRLARRDADGAREAFSKAVELDPHNYWYRDRLAMTWTLSGNTDEAIRQYESLLADFPKQTDIQYSLINQYLQKGENEKALGALDAIEGSVGKSDASVMTRFNLLRQQGDNEAAYRHLREYVEEYSSPYVLTMLGDYEIGMDNDSTAFAYYKEALSLDKGYAPARLGIAEAYRLTRRYPEYFSSLDSLMADTDIDAGAKADYLQAVLRHTDPRFQRNWMAQIDTTVGLAVSVHPADTLMLQTAGSWYAATGRMAESAAYFRRNMEVAPESLPAAATYVQIQSSLGNWDEIIEATEQSYARFPEQTAFLEMQNVAYYNKKDYKAVLANGERMLAAAGGDKDRQVSALSAIGDMYWQTGDRKNAFKTYDKALKINPDYAPVLNNYAWYLCQEGSRLKLAYKMSKKTIEQEPDNVTYLDTFGWILHLMGKDLEAKPFFKHALLYGGKESRVLLLHYARVLEVLGETDLASTYRMQAEKLPEDE